MRRIRSVGLGTLVSRVALALSLAAVAHAQEAQSDAGPLTEVQIELTHDRDYAEETATSANAPKHAWRPCNDAFTSKGRSRKTSGIGCWKSLNIARSTRHSPPD